MIRNLTVSTTTYRVESDEQDCWREDERSTLEPWPGIGPEDALARIRETYPSRAESRPNGGVRFYTEPYTIDYADGTEREHCADLDGFSALAVRVILSRLCLVLDK